MRTIIVTETPGKYISFLFEELKRNKRELKIACWNSEGKINIILQNFKTLKFIFLTLHLRNLIETMIGNKCNSGILVTDKKPSLINSILNLQMINKYKKIKFIIIE